MATLLQREQQGQSNLPIHASEGAATWRT